MAAMGGARIPGSVYAWVVVFLLPVNSAINPLLYTISSIRVRNKKKQKGGTTQDVTASSAVDSESGEDQKKCGTSTSVL